MSKEPNNNLQKLFKDFKVQMISDAKNLYKQSTLKVTELRNYAKELFPDTTEEEYAERMIEEYVAWFWGEDPDTEETSTYMYYKINGEKNSILYKKIPKNQLKVFHAKRKDYYKTLTLNINDPVFDSRILEPTKRKYDTAQRQASKGGSKTTTTTPTTNVVNHQSKKTKTIPHLSIPLPEIKPAATTTATLAQAPIVDTSSWKAMDLSAVKDVQIVCANLDLFRNEFQPCQFLAENEEALTRDLLFGPKILDFSVINTLISIQKEPENVVVVVPPPVLTIPEKKIRDSALCIKVTSNLLNLVYVRDKCVGNDETFKQWKLDRPFSQYSPEEQSTLTFIFMTCFSRIKTDQDPDLVIDADFHKPVEIQLEHAEKKTFLHLFPSVETSSPPMFHYSYNHSEMASPFDVKRTCARGVDLFGIVFDIYQTIKRKASLLPTSKLSEINATKESLCAYFANFQFAEIKTFISAMNTWLPQRKNADFFPFHDNILLSHLDQK